MTGFPPDGRAVIDAMWTWLGDGPATWVREHPPGPRDADDPVEALREELTRRFLDAYTLLWDIELGRRPLDAGARAELDRACADLTGLGHALGHVGGLRGVA